MFVSFGVSFLCGLCALFCLFWGLGVGFLVFMAVLDCGFVCVDCWYICSLPPCKVDIKIIISKEFFTERFTGSKSTENQYVTIKNSGKSKNKR